MTRASTVVCWRGDGRRFRPRFAHRFCRRAFSKRQFSGYTTPALRLAILRSARVRCLILSPVSDVDATDWGAPGFSWTLDCERVLAGGVSRWRRTIRSRRRRREPGGRPEGPPGVTGRGGFRPGVNARRYSACCGVRISSRCRGSWGSRRRGRLWRDQFLAAGQAGLKSRATDARDEDNRRLQAKVGELLMENELLYAKVDHLEAGAPLRRAAVSASSRVSMIGSHDP